MVNNQIEFNNKYPREVKEIKIKNKEFQGRLVIENYSNLEKLYLRDIESIDKIILKNLTQLQKCTIWNCGVQDLIIENCSQIKKLNIPDNSLTNLEFLKSLECLEELELDHNSTIISDLEYLPDNLKSFSYESTKLIEILKPYKGDWKICKKDIQKLKEIQRPHELLKNIRDLKEKNKKLKEKQPVTIDDPEKFQKKYQKLKGALNFITKEEKLKSKEIDSLVTNDILESIKEQKQDLSKLQKTKKELEKELSFFKQLYEAKKEKIMQKEKELEELKNNIEDKLNDEEQGILEELLEVQDDLVQSNSPFVRKQLEKNKNKLSSKLTNEEIMSLCQKQEQITQLRLEIQKNFNQIYINIDKIDRSIIHFESEFYDSSSAGTINNQIEIPPKGQN